MFRLKGSSQARQLDPKLLATSLTGPANGYEVAPAHHTFGTQPFSHTRRLKRPVDSPSPRAIPEIRLEVQAP